MVCGGAWSERTGRLGEASSHHPEGPEGAAQREPFPLRDPVAGLQVGFGSKSERKVHLRPAGQDLFYVFSVAVHDPP